VPFRFIADDRNRLMVVRKIRKRYFETGMSRTPTYCKKSGRVKKKWASKKWTMDKKLPMLMQNNLLRKTIFSVASDERKIISRDKKILIPALFSVHET